MDERMNEAPCFYFSTDESGLIHFMNKSLCNALGYGESELIGKKIDVIFTVPTRIFHQTHLFPLVKMQGYAQEIFVQLLSKENTQLPVLMNVERKITGVGGVINYAGILVLNRNKFEAELILAKNTAEVALHENTALTEAKLALQRNLEDLDQQLVLIHARNEEFKQINRILTHDLQEPLRKISVFISMLEEPMDPEAMKKVWNKMVRVSGEMRSLVSGLQQYVWLTETVPSYATVDLKKLLTMLKAKLANEFPEVKMVIELQDLPSIHGDPDQMEMLFYQLLVNAIRFRKDNVRAVIHISATSLVLNQFKKIEGKYKYMDYFRIEVKDEGIGFRPEFKEQLFKLFKRLHSNSGQGIGLSLCKKIIENHQGEISISSDPDQGTTVTILLPGTKEDAGNKILSQENFNSSI